MEKYDPRALYRIEFKKIEEGTDKKCVSCGGKAQIRIIATHLKESDDKGNSYCFEFFCCKRKGCQKDAKRVALNSLLTTIQMIKMTRS